MTANTREIPVEEATEAQLRKFAVETLGLDIDDGDTAAIIRTKMAPVHRDANITIEEKRGRKKSVKPSDEAEKKYVLINVHPIPGDPQKYISVGLNGKMMKIPTGEEVRIPVAYQRVLDDAMQAHYEKDNQDRLTETVVMRPKYPYTFIGHVDG